MGYELKFHAKSGNSKVSLQVKADILNLLLYSVFVFPSVIDT